MARTIEIARAEFKALQEAGVVIGTFKDWYAAKKAALAAAETVVTTQEAETAPISEVVETIQTAVEATTEVEPETEAAVKLSKAALAKSVFDEETCKAGGVLKLVRKNVLQRFMAEVGLTKAGANTYYQNLRDKAGVVDHLKAAS